MNNSGKNLKTLIKINGFTQKSFAKTLGFEYSNLNKWIIGVVKMPIDKMIRACEYFCVTLDEFVLLDLGKAIEEGSLYDKVARQNYIDQKIKQEVKLYFNNLPNKLQITFIEAA